MSMTYKVAGVFGVVLLGFVAACGSEPVGGPDSSELEPIEQGRRYVESREFRRGILEASLENPDNLYSRTRLAHYATGASDSWDALPVRRPWASPVTTADFGSFDTFGRREPAGAPASDPWSAEWTHHGLIALGERAFYTYPLRVDGRLAPVVESRENAERAGFWVDEEGRVGGVVAERLDNGTEMAAWTCSTCHASVRESGGPLVSGRSNASLDAGELYRLGGIEGTLAEGWRPGQLDPSQDATDNPTKIPDLRAVRYQSHLHAAASVANSLMALTVRIETLLIVSQNATSRPPRQLAFAMAYYLWNLPVTKREQASEQDGEAGRALFETNCSRCHHTDGSVAEPVDYRLVGTDPAAALSPARTTGRYRIPSLAGVGDRPYLLHDASVRSLDAFLDPERPATVPGHPFGLDLSAEDRRALIGFLHTLPLD